MPPKIALLGCLLFIFFVLKCDSRRRSFSSALWIPLVWLLIVASRSLPQWFGAASGNSSYNTMMDGNGLGRAVYSVLIIVGLLVLLKRRPSWREIAVNNKALFLLFLYFAISIIWSDFPWISLKRWYKSLGNVVMALIILTERDSLEALRSVVKRCGYILVPLSIVLIKYFPAIGRGFDPWSGIAENRGVSYNKNGLGCLLMICGFVFCWDTVKKWKSRMEQDVKYDLYVNVLLLSMVGWLFAKAHSATSFVSFLIGISIYVFFDRKDLEKSARRANRLAVFLSIVVAVFFFFGYDYFLSYAVGLTGHGNTFWGRVDLWKKLLQFNTNPLIGTGFESFWLGSRLSSLWSEYWWKPTEAHNGYLEIYLNLGLVGLVLFSIVFVTIYRKGLRRMRDGSDHGVTRLAFLFMFLFYNITEAALKGLSPVWLLFLVIAIDYRGNAP